MKKKLQLLIILLTALTSAINAQTVIFADNFDSYTTGTYLGSVVVPTYGGAYGVWKASGNVNATATTALAYSGTQAAKLTPSTANNFCSLRRTIAVTAGHNYTFSAWTNADGGTSSAKLNYQFNTTTTVKGSTTATYTANTWNQQSISFTAATSENVDVFISAYLYAAVVNVYSDDWMVVDNTVSTGLNNNSAPSVSIVKSETNELLVTGCEVNTCHLLDVSGKLLQTATQNNFSFNKAYKGVIFAKITDKSGLIYYSKFIL